VRLLFAGTPDAALPSLRALLRSRHEVVAVLTRPDARAGRGRTLRPSPVRAVAEDAGTEVLTPRSLRDPAVQDRIRQLAPDACPVVAYGLLVPPDLLTVPRHGWVNLHFSLLPAWRGAAPVQHAILAGDEVTGATTFLLEEGLDTGPVLGTLTESIGPRDTAGDLLGRLAEAGAELLVATLDALEEGTLVPVPQPAEDVSSAPKLQVEDARVDWSRPAYAVDRLVRACTPAPGAWTTFRGQRLKVHPVRPPDAADPDGAQPPGTMLVSKDAVRVVTGSGTVALGTVQPHGRQAMPAADWARGLRPEPGERLGG
jgi:methionyl-tRNA formyltransferase